MFNEISEIPFFLDGIRYTLIYVPRVLGSFIALPCLSKCRSLPFDSRPYTYDDFIDVFDKRHAMAIAQALNTFFHYNACGKDSDFDIAVGIKEFCLAESEAAVNEAEEFEL